MDGTTLNVSAPVFQPGGSKTNSTPTARQPSSLNMLPSASGLGTPLSDRNGGQSQPFQSTTLSQIQNQMTPGGGIPGGMVHMSASSRPFVPGGAAPSNLKPQTPIAPYQHAPQPSYSNLSRSPIPGHRLGHGMTPGSVQLTGPPAFLATPPIITNMPPTPGFTGPPSPLSPNVSVPASPFIMPHGQANLGLPYPGAVMNANVMKLRKGKGPQPVTPLKSNGHNSTPSISMNPAAFAASLAALKVKKKVVVSIPHEKPLSGDEALLAQSEDEPKDDGDAEVTDLSKAENTKRRHARAAASTRQKWAQRQPLDLDQHDLISSIQVPEDAIVTCEVHPEPWPHSLGLPDTIEIYLPGMSAWDEYLEMRAEEQQMEADAETAAEQDDLSSLARSKQVLSSKPAAFKGDDKGRSLSISTPADPNMVSFKLNRFLQSQRLSIVDPNEPNDDDENNTPSLEDQDKSFGRFPLRDLPNRLREAFARRRGESTHLHFLPNSKHSHTMSLGLPNSGGAFGPEVFSALNMIRANSDEGPSKPPSEAQDLPDKPLSDSDAMPGKDCPFLANIAEDDAEIDEAEVRTAGASHDPKSNSSDNWQDLGRGFGYEPEPQASVKSGRRHARQASRISVSTSRRGDDEGDELLSDREDVEVRTNPSEDADASDFEEELHDYGPEHWHDRHTSVHVSAFGDAHDRSDFEVLSNDEDSLRDSLTPSDEQFSNPSDEEAAREERILRRQHRAAERAARRERINRQRGRANTNNTLPSSSIGEADVHQHGRYDYAHEYHPRQRRQSLYQDEIVSNPSDEVQSDLDDSQTFGHLDQHACLKDDPHLSQDFRFPPPQPPTGKNSQARHGESNGPAMSGTLSRASGISLLNPDAKEFKFGGASAATRAVSAPLPSTQYTHEDTPAHFRLPSIKTSSFGSAFGDVAATAPHLNVAAPSFTPGIFNFKAPVRLQVPEMAMSSSPNGAPSAEAGNREAENRAMQGREKRTRYGPIDYNSEDERYAAYNTSPPRPKASAASIEGPLRSFSSLARQVPPPFLTPGFGQQQKAISHDSRFTAEAPSFVPTWAKGAAGFGGSTSFKRPSLPDWSKPTEGDAEQKLAPSIRDPQLSTMETRSKAIPIRRPSENIESASMSRSNSSKQDLAPGQSSGSMDKLSAANANTFLVASPDGRAHGGASVDIGQTSTETLMGPAEWAGPKGTESTWPEERARPINIPLGPHSYQSSVASPGSDAGAGPSVRWNERHSSSSIGVSSIDRRVQRDRSGHHHHHLIRVSDEGAEEDDESLTDFVEEIVERVDKVLEGWAGKILDEVTIMGQVRPHPRTGVAAAELDQDKIVLEISKRMEEALDTHLVTTFSAHVRKASDETQTTIRPTGNRHSSPDQKMSSSALVDAPGEWDFDYVQDIFEVKLGEIREQIETAMAQVIGKLDSSALPSIEPSEGNSGSALSSEFVETITARLVDQVRSLFETHNYTAKEAQTASEDKLQQALQAKLDENLFLLSEKSAADRSNIQHMLESEIHSLERSLSSMGASVQAHLSTALKETLPSLLEDRASGDAGLADRLTNQLGAALGPVFSEERRCLLEDNQRSRDLFLQALPSPASIAVSTVKAVEPLIKSLKKDPIDSDSLVTRLAEVIGKQSIEHMVDLNPVLALLEPLIAKQEDARSFSKRILQRQEDAERTLGELPAAINAKVDIFLSSSNESNERQGMVLEKVTEIKAELERKANLSAVVTSIDTERIKERLDDLSQDKELTRKTAEKTLTELAQVYQVLNSSYEALSRLEAQHTLTEGTHREITEALASQAKASEKLAGELRAAEAKAVAAEASRAGLSSQLDSKDKENELLANQLAQLKAELAATKTQASSERESSTKAVTEANTRADRAESTLSETTARLSTLLGAANTAEREAYESAKSVLERASKAEGQVSSLEKRISEQDVKIANLQSLTAAQKQKAAISHQKLAEGEKRIKESEAKLGELEELRAKVHVLDGRETELEQAKRHLRESEERETRLRAELKEYGERFGELEKDLLLMKENLVEKAVHEMTVSQLTESQELVEKLEAQLQARDADGWEAVEKPRTGAWASMHAPKVKVTEDEGESSGELAMEGGRSMRSVSFASSAGESSRGKEVQADQDGWWS
ncbi:related to transport protein USO1 [Melanopsichium pennsylvanicum]|uniref:Related to transport protein USO1 n=2 Tax=Melanopsichium pennsylvanicum TaxID=63383 RepID=A0AAJ4XT67_9BASI|nr:putative protein [Melanopsichium pennsylvanicum 4]SNX86663.1 related to transport protein USO1 [Melanopsichium pennsylvanicum]